MNTITIYFEDKAHVVPAAITVASALLGHLHVEYTGTHPLSGARRAPCCMMGVCHECLMEINGVHNCQACLTTVEDGMRVYRERPLQEESVT